jgi:glutathione reductase (NADPH)
MAGRYDFDYFVIGGGSGGVRSARIAGAHGARVGIAEERHLGGTCVNVGCVPKKLFTYAAHYAHDFEDAAGYGWSVPERSFSWRTLIENKNREIARLNGVYRKLLEGAGVEIFDTRASLEDAHTIRLSDDRRVTAETILIAVGGQPSRPSEPGTELGITSDDVFFLDELPRHITVCGGGYIAVEFSGIFKALGVEVTHLYRGRSLLRGFDRDLGQALAAEMMKQKIDLRFETIISRLAKTRDGFAATLSDGRLLETGAVLFAIGRRPMTAGLGLEKAGVACDEDGAVIVDGVYKTSAENIYAVGDVTNRVNLTPVAIAEGHIVADRLFGNRARSLGYEFIPTAVFSNPPIATVGYAEEAARKTFGAIDVYRTSFRPMKHTLSGRDERTVMKLIVERASDRVVGAHMIGQDAPEIIQGVGIAVNAGATKAHFDATIGIHPTAAEEFVTLRTPLPPPSAPED